MAEKKYIEREALLEHLEEFWKDGCDYRAVRVTNILNIPTADVVEVVRCKDCQYAKPYERNDGQMGYYCQHQNCTFLYGMNWERLFEPIKEANDFCSYGAKMDGKGEGE